MLLRAGSAGEAREARQSVVALEGLHWPTCGGVAALNRFLKAQLYEL